MADIPDESTPTVEVRIFRDGVLVQRELCESEEEAEAVVDRWSDVEGVVVQVEDLARDRSAVGVLDARPWEADDDRFAYEAAAYDDLEG